MSKDPVDAEKIMAFANKAKTSLDYSNELIQNILDDRYLKSVPKNDDEKFTTFFTEFSSHAKEFGPTVPMPQPHLKVHVPKDGTVPYVGRS